MGSDRNGPITPDLFAEASAQRAVSRPPKPATSSRHILPGDLPSAIKHLNDQELDQLQAAVTAEQRRRGNEQLRRVLPFAYLQASQALAAVLSDHVAKYKFGHVPAPLVD